MALTKDVIKANAVLSGLTDEQLAAIETLSQNDENAIIAQKTGKIYGDLDADILAASGVAKNGTEKTYDYAKRVLGDFKTKAESASGLQSTIETLTKDKAKLEKAIADGATDEETKKQLKQIKAELETTKTQFNDLQTKHTEAETTHKEKLFGLQVGFELKNASAGVKLKPELPQSATGVLMQQAMEKLRTAYKPDYIEDGNGGQRLVFRNESGAVMNNPENQLNPYTAAELLTKELKTMGILDEGRQQGGGGTNPPAGGGQGGKGTAIDVSGARNQVEATTIITKTLMGQGLTKGSNEFQTQFNQVWGDSNVGELPEQ